MPASETSCARVLAPKRRRLPIPETGAERTVAKVAKIGKGKIGSAKIGNGKIGNGKIGNGKIGNGKIGNGKFGWHAAVLFTLLRFAPVAHAAPAPFVALEYEVPADQHGCPDAAEFRANIQHQLGYDPFQPAGGRRVSVQIGHKGSGLEGRIRWSDAGGHWIGDRRLSSRRADCAELATNLGFAVAVQVQLLATLTAPPEAAAEPSAGGPSSAETSSTADAATNSGERADAASSSTAPLADASQAAPPPEATASAKAPKDEGSTPSRSDQPPTLDGTSQFPRTAADAHLALSVGAGPALAVGLAPRATALGRLFVGGRIDHFSLELGLDASWPVEQRDSTAAGFSLERLGASLAGCGHFHPLAACALGAVGTLRASGLGVDQPASPTGVFTQVGVRIVARHDFDAGLFIAAHMEGLVLLSRWTVRVNDVGAWMTPRIGVVAGVDVGVGFF